MRGTFATPDRNRHRCASRWPAHAFAAARVINCISLGQFEKQWLLALALDEPGNVWGIESAPQDWQE